MQTAVARICKCLAEVCLAQGVTRFMQCNGFNIIGGAISPPEGVVVICFAKRYIQFAVGIDVRRVPVVISKNDCEGYAKNEGAALRSKQIEKGPLKPSGMNH